MQGISRNWGTQRTAEPRFIRGLTAGRRPLCVPGCLPLDRRLFVCVNPFHARHIREILHPFSGNKFVFQYPFYLRTVCANGARSCRMEKRPVIIYLSNPKPGHTTGGSGRGGARRGGGAGRGGAGRRQLGSPRKQPTLLPPGYRRQLS